VIDPTTGFEERFRTLRDEELVRILRGEEGEYEPEAIAAAKAEVARRDIGPGKFRRLVEDVDQAKAEQEARDAEPLPTKLRILCLVLPVLAGPPIAVTQASKGLRRWKEAWSFAGLGFLLWVLAVIVVSVLTRGTAAM
jgi:hypothetical protein